MPRIVLKGVSKSFAGAEGKSVTAVDRLTLTVQDREMLALVGPSGCGKTTTLRLLAGLESPDTGQILFDDKPVTAQPPVERDVAMVFQSHALFPHFNAFDNIAFGLKLRHVSKAEINSRVRETADLLGITHCLDRKPGELSGGERQRVALGRAIIRGPEILLLDEPFSNLDEPLRVQMQSELLALRSRLNMTVIYVTHDQAEALALGDRVAVLHRGSLQQVGPSRELYDAPANAFVASFVGSPPMNLFHGTILRSAGQAVFRGIKHTSAGAPPFELPLGGGRAGWFAQNADRQVLLGVRPENIKLASETASAEGAATVVATVQSCQYQGMETLVRLKVDESTFVARIRSAAPPQPEQKVALTFNLASVRLYDPATGALLF